MSRATGFNSGSRAALPGPTPPHRDYRPDIDGLRAVAVVAVVIFHAFPDILGSGFIGVDVFFVISGFLISTIIFGSLSKDKFSFAEFYGRRIRRIFPSLLLVMIACYATGWHVLLADEFRQLGKHIAGGAGFVSNFILWNEAGYFDNSADTKPLLHLWSLGVEEQFYIVWPLVLWAGWKMGAKGAAPIVIALVLSFGLSKLGAGQSAIGDFYSPLTRFWELLCGSLLAWTFLFRRDAVKDISSRISRWMDAGIGRVHREGDGQTLANILSAAGALLLGFGFWQIDQSVAFPGYWALLPVLGTVLLIAAGRQAWINRAILSNRIAVWIGLISFPLYLWHWPLLSFARIMESETPTAAIRLGAVALAFVLAALTYFAIERPMRFGHNLRAKTAGLVLLMGVAGFAGLDAWSQKGFPARAHLQAFEAVKKQFDEVEQIGRPAEARIMVLGDSHAEHLTPGLKAVFGPLVADYTGSGCIPFFDVDRYDRRIAPGTCLKAINDSLNALLASKTMNGVILASMGPVYLTDEPFNGMARERVLGQGVRLASEPGLTDRREIYVRGLRNTLQRLTAAQKKVLFVLDVPELGFDPRTCVETRPAVLTQKARPVCAVPRQEYEARTGWYRALVRSVLRDFPQVIVYDPATDFCDKTYCRAMSGGDMLYRDMDHLTIEGSEFLARRMAPLVEQLK